MGASYPGVNMTATPLPFYWGNSETHGLTIRKGDETIAQTKDAGEAYAFALALMLGQEAISGQQIPDMAARVGITINALELVLSQINKEDTP
jgi:hypothetical protein